MPDVAERTELLRLLRLLIDGPRRGDAPRAGRGVDASSPGSYACSPSLIQGQDTPMRSHEGQFSDNRPIRRSPQEKKRLLAELRTRWPG
jgi:hypothetical protein